MATESMTDAFDLAQRTHKGSLVVLTESDSDTEKNDDVFDKDTRRSSIFDRPGFGHVAFR
jgi:hypothetical protein